VKVSRKDILVTTFGMKHRTRIRFWNMEAGYQGKESAVNKSFEQEQDPTTSFHKGPMPLRGVKGHTTATATTTTTTTTKAVPLPAMKALGGRGGISPTHTRPPH
jgi:hypothetical protein